MNIGQASRLTGLSARTIRLYEAEGIIAPMSRGSTGYRSFGPEDLRTLNFVHNARRLNFDLREIKSLVTLWRSGTEGANEVEAVIALRVDRLLHQESELRATRECLQNMQQHSASAPRPGCGILALLAGDLTTVCAD